MDLFRPRQPRSALLANPRAPADNRLSTIDENPLGPGASRDGLAHGHAVNQPASMAHNPNLAHSAISLPRASAESKPPSYKRAWRQENLSYSEKAGWASPNVRTRRGGWGRFIIIAAAIIVALAIALGVGLGVGLTRRNSNNSSNSSSSGSSSSNSQSSQQGFPLGQYTFVTALGSVQTNCTSNTATWRCYPYQTYADANSTAGLTYFNWDLSSTASTYASNLTDTTTDSSGIPANITLSSNSNPFSMNITAQNLTFINNDFNPRLTVSFTYTQSVVPSTSIDANNTAATCLYKDTLFTATMYLSNAVSVTFPGSGLSSSAVNGGYTQWPYAVEVIESVSGGSNIPACYETSNGAMGEQISGFTAQSSSAQCQCLYSNHFPSL